MHPIHKWITEGKLRKALELMHEVAPASLKSDVIALGERLSSLLKKERLNLSNEENLGVERSKVVNAAIELSKLIIADVESDGVVLPSSTPAFHYPRVYFSYSSDAEMAENAANLQQVELLHSVLSEKGFEVRRDVMDIRFGELVSEFLHELGEADHILIFLSEYYLKSPYCMFELMEIARNAKWDKREFKNRILIISLQQLDLHTPEAIRYFLGHWKAEEEKWQDLIRDMPDQLGSGTFNRYDYIKKIRNNISELLDWLTDIRSGNFELLSDNDFQLLEQTILSRLRRKLDADKES